MKINELLVESKQLNEGPFTQAIGRGAGKVAKGVANIGKDLKTGFKAGYSDEQPPADPNAAPVKKKANPTWAGIKQGIARASGVGTSTTPARSVQPVPTQTGTAASQPQTQTQTQTGPTVYAQVKANIDKLDKKGKQRIMQLLQKSLGAPSVNPATTPVKPDQATIDADRERIMGSNSGESTVRLGKVVAESFSLFRKQ
jgi:hypothetical protein